MRGCWPVADRTITMHASAEDMEAADKWEHVLLDAVSRDGGSGSHGLMRVRVTAPFPHDLPEGAGVNLLQAVRDNWDQADSDGGVTLGQFTDDRGEILDILAGPIDCVTRISTRKNHIRGNHRHNETRQWTLILEGRLLIVTEDGEIRTRREYGPGEMAEDRPGVAHAWRAISDCTALVFARGRRAGTAYESDTVRLKVPLLS